MRLNDLLIIHGNFLFRWRNYTPFILVPIFFLAAPESARLEKVLGDADSHIWTFCCMGVSLVGLLIRSAGIGFAARGTSGRNRHSQIADSLNTTGVYSIVRHPLYLGNYLGLLGLLASTLVWWVVVIGSLVYWLILERIIEAEESYLAEKFGADFTIWAAATPAFVPIFPKWVSSGSKFNWREVLKREYNGVMALGASYFLIEAILDLYGEGQTPAIWFREDFPWFIIFMFSLIIMVSLRTIKKTTRLLSESRPT